MALLDAAELDAALAAAPHWTLEGASIARSVTAASFLDGIDLVAAVARIAEEADHHPDIDIRWRTVTFTLSTHSAGGLTAQDFDLARAIDEVAP